MLILPEINFLHLIPPVALLLVGGWMTPTPSQGPPIPQGERGGLMGFDRDHGRGVRVGPGTWNMWGYIYRYIYIYIDYLDIFEPIISKSISRIATNQPTLLKRKQRKNLAFLISSWVHKRLKSGLPAFSWASIFAKPRKWVRRKIVRKLSKQ